MEGMISTDRDGDRYEADKKANQCGALFTVEPFGVVLGGAQGRHVPQAPVDDGVAPGEVDHRGGIQLSPLRYHGGRVVPRVIGTSGDTVHCVQHLTDVINLKGSVNRHKHKQIHNKQTTN